MVKFREPGLGAHDSISFSEGILKSILFSKGVLSDGGAPITNDDLCKAKITYMFSDGFTTTSNFGHCPAVSLPLIASSWRPDPHVAPHIIKPNKTNLLLAQMQSSAPSGAVVMGSAWVNRNAALNAMITAPNSLGAPDVTFTVPSSACSGMGLTLCFNDTNGTLCERLSDGRGCDEHRRKHAGRPRRSRRRQRYARTYWDGNPVPVHRDGDC